MFQRILVAYDGSADSKAALDIAIDLASRYSGEVYLLTVIENLPKFAATIGEVVEAEREATEEIEKIQAEASWRAGHAGVQIKRKILAGHEVDAILAYAAKIKADVLCLGRKGFAPLWSTHSGRTAMQVATHAPCTVIMAKAKPE
jgi:nucleotide-binding universal stress UspA family protein